MTIGRVTNSTEPNTEVSHRPRSGLRHRHRRAGKADLDTSAVWRRKGERNAESPGRRIARHQFVRMKWLSARAPATLRASHQRCDGGGSNAGAAVNHRVNGNQMRSV